MFPGTGVLSADSDAPRSSTVETAPSLGVSVSVPI